MGQPWLQNFNPLGNAWLSTIAAAIPISTLIYFLAIRRTAAWLAAVFGFLAAVIVSLVVFRMPAKMVAGAVADGLVYGWFRIAWIAVAAVFVYDVSVESGQFAVVKQSIANISTDRRLQVLLIAFAFGGLLEGAGGGGAPVAITGAMLIGLGFPPFETTLICLIANSAPVAFGSLGNPVRTLVAVTGLPEADFSAMLGRILPWSVLVLPFWLIRILSSARDTLAVWPGLLAGGVTFAAIQFFWSNYMDAALVDLIGGIVTLIVLAIFFHRVWKPRDSAPIEDAPHRALPVKRIAWAWLPFLLIGIFVVIWGLPGINKSLERTTFNQPVPGLHLQTVRMPPVVPQPEPQPALFDGAWLAAPGTAVFFAGIVAGLAAGLSLRRTLGVFVRCVARLSWSVVAIMAMLGTGFLTRYCGMDATMGMAMSHTGALFPLFGTLIGWLGVALSGTDAGSNALFGSFQVITAQHLGLSPILMGAANSAGGVMGKMIAAQSLVIGCAATGQQGKEGLLFRAVLKHSAALALLVGLIVLAYAYLFPGAIPNGHRYW